MGLCLLRGDVKHDARCGLASSMCGYSRIAVDRLEWFQTLGRLLCYVDFSLCANRNRIPNDPVASKDRRQGTDPFFATMQTMPVGISPESSLKPALSSLPSDVRATALAHWRGAASRPHGYAKCGRGLASGLPAEKVRGADNVLA